MQISYKTKRLLAIAIGIIIIAIAANEGTKDIGRPQETRRFPYPFVPLDIDPRALERIDAPSTIVDKTPVEPNKSPVPRPTTISAEAYLVASPVTGEIYAEREQNHVFPIASLSKLITSIVALHHMQSSQKITITQSMLDAYGDAGHLVLGETYTLSEILYPLLLESSNDAAEAIAQTYGYASFIREMNDFVHGLGMNSTSFKDASGLNSGNDSNAHDLLILAKYIYGNEKSLLEVTRQPVWTVASTTDHGAHTWHTINPFPYDPHFLGGKTGRTNEAKESMMSFFHYQVGDTDYPVVIIVLRSDFSVREIDSSLLFSQFIRKIGAVI